MPRMAKKKKKEIRGKRRWDRDNVPDTVKMLKKKEERRLVGGIYKAISQLCLHQSCVV